MIINPRKVKIITIINILKKYPSLMQMGLFFTLGPIFILALSLLGNQSEEAIYPQIDYDLINQKGVATVAEIINIETQYNTTINEVHPITITYIYLENEKVINDKFTTLDERKVKDLEIGNEIQIKTLNGDSTIQDLKPYNNSPYVELIFFIIGLAFLAYPLKQLRKELDLIKYGRLTQGEIVSLVPNSGRSITNSRKGIVVHYQYTTSEGKIIIGESFTIDQSIMNRKDIDDFLPIFISKENEENSCMVSKLEALRNNWNIKF